MACYTEVYYITADSSKQTGDQVFVIGGQLSQLRRLHLEKRVRGWRSDSTVHKESSDAKQELRKDLVSTSDPAWPAGAGTGRMEPSGLASQTQG